LDDTFTRCRDADFLRQAFADLDELLGLDDRVEPRVLGPVVEMLGQAVGGRDVRELVGLAERRAVVLEHARPGCSAPAGCRGAAGCGERRVERLVVLGERAFGHRRARKKRATPSGFMMNGPIPPPAARRP
jgi:hypothetical protein